MGVWEAEAQHWARGLSRSEAGTGLSCRGPALPGAFQPRMMLSCGSMLYMALQLLPCTLQRGLLGLKAGLDKRQYNLHGLQGPDFVQVQKNLQLPQPLVHLLKLQ